MYSCEKCDFHSSNKKDYRRHLLTRKHEIVHDSKNENTKHLYTCICGKSYRFSQGLSRHKRTCKRVIQDIHDGDHLDLKDVFPNGSKHIPTARKQMTPTMTCSSRSQGNTWMQQRRNSSRSSRQSRNHLPYRRTSMVVKDMNHSLALQYNQLAKDRQ